MHKQKLKSRQIRIEQQKNSLKKEHKKQLLKLIEEENKKGAFNSPPKLNLPNQGDDTPFIEGPII